MGNASSKGPFSLAMLDYRSVYQMMSISRMLSVFNHDLSWIFCFFIICQIRHHLPVTIFRSHRSYRWCCPTHGVMWRRAPREYTINWSTSGSTRAPVKCGVGMGHDDHVWFFDVFWCCLSAGATSRVIFVIQFAQCWGVGAQKRDKVWWSEGGY